MGEALDLLCDALAAHRLTRLVTADVVTQPWRSKLVEGAYVKAGRADDVRGEVEPDFPEGYGGRWDEFALEDTKPPKLATLVTCRWCTGVYVAFGIAAARAVLPKQWRWASRALALASAAALIARYEDE